MENRYIQKRRRRLERRIKRGKYRNEYSLYQAKNSLYRKILKEKITKAELIFRDYLIANKINFHFQKGFLKPFHRIVDFYLPRTRTIVEIDGGYHQDTIDKDKYKDTKWFERGYKTIRITNEEVYSGDFIKKIPATFLV